MHNKDVRNGSPVWAWTGKAWQKAYSRGPWGGRTRVCLLAGRMPIALLDPGLVSPRDIGRMGADLPRGPPVSVPAPPPKKPRRKGAAA